MICRKGHTIPRDKPCSNEDCRDYTSDRVVCFYCDEGQAITLKNVRIGGTMEARSKILITGAGGFIGSHLAKKLYEEGHMVRVADIKYDGYFKERYFSQKYLLDLRVLSNCLEAVMGVDYVFNLAANMGGIGYITAVNAEIMRDNVLINTNMLEAARIAGIKRYFYSSSACIYPNYLQTEYFRAGGQGSRGAEGLRESDDMPADPNEAYGWEKLFTEFMAMFYKKDYGLDTRIGRFHNIYGPYGTYDGGREKAPAALCRKVAKAKDGGSIEIWGDGLATRSFCYIDDCVRAVIALMESDYDKPINIGTDRLVTIDALADIIIGISGKKLEKVHLPSMPEGVKGRNADLTLVREVLGWEPVVPLEVGLRLTYEWIMQQAQGWAVR